MYFRIVTESILLFSVLIFIGVLSILAGTTAAALADGDGDYGRFEGDRRFVGPAAILGQDEMDAVATSVPRECQEPPADDMSVLFEAIAGAGPVRI